MAQAPRLTLEQRQDLANDPRIQNPQIRAQVLAKLGPEDAAWLTGALKPDAPTTGTSLMNTGLEYVKSHPIETGAAIGGVASAPFTGGMGLLPAMGLSALTSAGGAGYGALAGLMGGSDEPLPRSVPDALKLLAVEGATGAAGEGTGRAIGAAMRGGGNLLMNEVVPSDIAKDFPSVNIGEVLNRHAIVPTTARGAARAGEMRHASGAETQRLADEATAQGVPGITRHDVEPALVDARRQATREAKAGIPGGQDTIERRIDALFDPHALFGDIPLSDAPDVTRVLQNEGKIVRKQLSAGKAPTDLEGSVADGLAGGVRRVANERIPGYQASNANTQELIAATQAAEKMSKQPLRLGGFLSRLTAGGLATGGAVSGDPLAGLLSATVPLTLGTPTISAPLAMALYQGGKLPYSLLLKIVGPEAVKQAGLTAP